MKHFALNTLKQYEESLAVKLKSNPKLFQSYIKHKKVNRPTTGPIILNDGKLCDDPTGMATCFVNSFASVYQLSSPLNPSPHQMCDSVIDKIVISASQTSGCG